MLYLINLKGGYTISKSKLLLFVSLLIIMLSVSMVTATTEADNTTTPTFNDAVKVSAENDAIATSQEDYSQDTIRTESKGNSFKDLKEALEESDYIHLTQDYVFD